jgi:hypothetical protein
MYIREIIINKLTILLLHFAIDVKLRFLAKCNIYGIKGENRDQEDSIRF